MKTPNQLAQQGKSAVAEYKGWIIIIVLVYVLYKFNGLFSGLGDTAKLKLEAATADARAKAELDAANSKAKSEQQIAKAKVTYIAPGASDADVAQYQADAETIAGALGTKKGVYSLQWVFSDSQTAFSTLKNKYSRLLLSNNMPWNATTRKSQTKEDKYSAKRKVNYTVLQPFYSDITGGRNLVADVKNACSSSKYQPQLGWIL